MSSNVSKTIVTCGICGYEGRRDNMKKQHFPSMHPWVLYIKKGEKRFSFKKEDNTKVTLEEPSLGEASTDVKDLSVIEESQEEARGDVALEEVVEDMNEGAASLQDRSKEEIKSNSDVTSEILLEEILKLKDLMTFQQEVKHEAWNLTASNVKEKLDLLQTSKSIE